MNMKTLDKKQIPQFAALCVVTSGVFGYLVVHFVAPGSASAQTRPAAAVHPAVPVPAANQASAASQTSVVPSKTGAAASTGTSADSTDIPDAPPPTPAMHDPFAVGYADPATTALAAAPVKAPALLHLPAPGKKVADLGAVPLPVGPSAPALPGSFSPFPVHSSAPMAGGMTSLPQAAAQPALPQAPAAPSWTVTGVLLGESGTVAILRSGEARRIVRSGDFVDGTYRVTSVTRTSVVLRHGAAVYQLPLGGTKAEPLPAEPRASLTPAAFPALRVPAPMPRSAAVLDGTLIPVSRTAFVRSPLAHPKHWGKLALAPAAPSPASCAPLAKSLPPAKVAASVSLGLRLLDGSVLAQNSQENNSQAKNTQN